MLFCKEDWTCDVAYRLVFMFYDLRTGACLKSIDEILSLGNLVSFKN